MKIQIRNARSSDSDQIRQIHLDAFGEDEGESVATLACDLLKQPSTPETLNLVAEIEGDLAGHVAFSPVWFAETDDLAGYTLAPLAVAPGNQKSGVGKALVEEGLRQMEEQNVGAVLVYGDPAYYERFGFRSEPAEAFLPPFPLKYPFGWLARVENSKPDPSKIRCVEPLNKPELW